MPHRVSVLNYMTFSHLSYEISIIKIVSHLNKLSYILVKIRTRNLTISSEHPPHHTHIDDYTHNLHVKYIIKYIV